MQGLGPPGDKGVSNLKCHNLKKLDPADELESKFSWLRAQPGAEQGQVEGQAGTSPPQASTERA